MSKERRGNLEEEKRGRGGGNEFLFFFQLTAGSRSPPPSVLKSGASGWSCLRNRWTVVEVRVTISRGLHTSVSLLYRTESAL